MNLAKKKAALPHVKTLFISNLIFLVTVYLIINNHNSMDYILILFAELWVFVILVFIVELFLNKHNAIINFATTVSGFFYITLSFASLICLRNFHNIILDFNSNMMQIATTNLYRPISLLGDEAFAWLVICILGSVWTCDTVAYFVGSRFGKHKLFPRVSPKKSWEGAIGGFIGAIIGSVVLTRLLIVPELSIVHAIVIGCIVGTFGQIGDLAESLLKRDAVTKDSSHLIPGHGGMLDRLDSLLFVFPIVLIYFLVVMFLS
jgi:phosphatidate cytidylyltransferase